MIRAAGPVFGAGSENRAEKRTLDEEHLPRSTKVGIYPRFCALGAAGWSSETLCALNFGALTGRWVHARPYTEQPPLQVPAVHAATAGARRSRPRPQVTARDRTRPQVTARQRPAP